MNFISPKIFAHHRLALNEFFNPSSASPYTLIKAIRNFFELVNIDFKDFFSLHINEKKLDLIHGPNNTCSAITEFTIKSGRHSHDNYLIMEFPVLDENCFIPSYDSHMLADSKGSPLIPTIRLFRKPHIEFIENSDDEFKFKLAPGAGPHLVFNYHIKSGELKIKRDKPSSHRDDQRPNAEKDLVVGSPRFRESGLFKLITEGSNGGERFTLSKHLRLQINEVFGADGKDEEKLTADDLAIIKKALNKAKHAEDLKALEYYLELHLPGILSEYETVLLNESFYSGTLNTLSKRYYASRDKFKKMCEFGKLNLNNFAAKFREGIFNKQERFNDNFMVNLHDLAGFELPDTTNPLSLISHYRKVSFLDKKSSKGYKSTDGLKVVRDVNVSTLGRLCPIETPESEKLGLIAFLARGAEVDVIGGEILSTVKKGKVTYKEEEKAFLEKTGASLHELIFENKFNPLEFEDDFLKWKFEKNCPYAFDDVSVTLGYAAATMPFIQNTDATRALMGSKNMKSAVPLLKSQKPIISTGFESAALDEKFGSGALFAPFDAVLKSFDPAGNYLYFTLEKENGETETIKCERFRSNSTHTFSGFIPAVHVRDSQIKKGCLLAYSPAYNEDGAALPFSGQNLLCAYSVFEGYNFEDGIVISDRLVKEDILTSLHIVELRKKYAAVGARDESRLKLRATLSSLLFKEVENDEWLFIDPETGRIVRSDEEYSGTVVDAGIRKIDSAEDGISYDIVFIRFLQKRKVAVGDKLMGRYGNKGVISLILPENKMPAIIVDSEKGLKKHVDIIINPNGLVSRMNLGQVFETQLSPLAASGRLPETIGRPFDKNPAVEKAVSSVKNFRELVESARNTGNKANVDGKYPFALNDYDEKMKVRLYTETGGKFFEEPVLTGYQYFFKLNHLAGSKIHSRGEKGPYLISSRQPVKGRKHGGGQRTGEMEMWCLLAAGARNTVKKLLNEYSQQKAKNEKDRGNATTLAMQAWFRCLGLDIDLENFPESYDTRAITMRNITQVMKAGGLTICGYEDPDKFENNVVKTDNYFAKLKKWIEKKKQSASYELISEKIFGKIKFEGTDTSVYKKFGFIKFPYPIVNPLLAEDLVKYLKKSGKGSPKRGHEKDAIFRMLGHGDGDEMPGEAPEDAPKLREEDIYDTLLDIYKDFDQAAAEINKARMDFLLVPTPALRFEKEWKNLNAEENSDRKNLSAPWFKLFLNKTYFSLLQKCLGHSNSESYSIYPLVKKLFFNDGEDERHELGILKTLASKDGFLRNKMLGRRINYSARAVIVPDPKIALGEVIIPLKTAATFFGKEHKFARGKVECESLNLFVQTYDKYVLFNRQPSLHRFSMQAFRVAGVCRENVIKMHPLSCEGLNADFDGDTAAIYYISEKSAQAEISNKMGIFDNLMAFHASDKHLLHYEQDFSLGQYLLLSRNETLYKEFTDELEKLELKDKHRDIIGGFMEKLEKARAMIEDNKKEDKNLFLGLAKKALELKFSGSREEMAEAGRLLKAVDALKKYTLKAATLFGVSVGLFDLVEAREVLNARYGGNELKPGSKIFETEREVIGKNNGLDLLISSGARDNSDQIMQLLFPRGRMQTMRGEDGKALDTARSLRSGLLEGHDFAEYFTSIHGSRCGVASKKLLTPICGHFTRMLVEALYDIRIADEDCNCPPEDTLTFDCQHLKNILKLDKANEMTKFLKYCCLYRYDENGILITPELLTQKIGDDVFKAAIKVRSPLYCRALKGVCAICHGNDQSRNILAPKGYFAGLNAAQTIGERGTQLAMKMFHSGGIAKEGTFGNAVAEVKKALTENIGKGFAEAFNHILKKAGVQYILKNRIPAVNFELLCRGLINDKKITVYSHESAGLRQERKGDSGRDFLARASYKKLVRQTIDELKRSLGLDAEIGGAVKYSNLSEKTKVLVSKL